MINSHFYSSVLSSYTKFDRLHVSRNFIWVFKIWKFHIIIQLFIMLLIVLKFLFCYFPLSFFPLSPPCLYSRNGLIRGLSILPLFSNCLHLVLFLFLVFCSIFHEFVPLSLLFPSLTFLFHEYLFYAITC